MNKLILLLSFSCLLFSCSKDLSPANKSVVNYTGLLDSVAYFADTTNTITQAAYLKFSYDSLKRIKKMQVYDRHFFFTYNDSSVNPYQMVDSFYNVNAPNCPVIQKYNFLYDGNGKKIKDSIFAYYQRNLSANTVSYSQPVIAVRNYTHGSNSTTSLTKGSFLSPDYFYYNSDGDVTNYIIHSGGDQFNAYPSYYTVENPFHQLNVRNCIAEMYLFLAYQFYPLSVDPCMSKHHFKTMTGNNALIYIVRPNEQIFSTSSYTLNTENKVVTWRFITTYFYNNVQLSNITGATMKFFYHP